MANGASKLFRWFIILGDALGLVYLTYAFLDGTFVAVRLAMLMSGIVTVNIVFGTLYFIERVEAADLEKKIRQTVRAEEKQAAAAAI